MLIDSQTLLFPKPIICNIILIDNKNKNNKYIFHSHFIFFAYPLYNFRFIHIISIYPNNRVCSKFRYRKKSICTRGYASLLYLAVVYRQNSSLPFDQAIYTNNGSSQQQEIRNFRQHGARRRCAKGSSGSKARGNYKTTTPTVSTFIMSTSTDVTLFGNHPARHLCFGIYIYTGASLRITLLPSSLFLLRSLRGDSSFESFSARRIASFRRIFYKLWPFRKAVLLYRLSRSNASNHSFVTNA